MGRLSGFRYRQVVKKLTKHGFELYRTGKGSHEIWYCKDSNLFTTIPKHRGDIPEGTLQAILKQADISPDQFLEL